MKTGRTIGMAVLTVIVCSLMAACSSDDEEKNGLNGNRIKTIQINGVKFDMVKVQGGTFQMGATPTEIPGYILKDYDFSDERPIHDVTLSDYYIGETEVTQELWQAVMGSNPSRFTGSSLLPVETVSWNDCQEFINKLNAITGKHFRLPTEAEWEFAARGGNLSQGFGFSGSNKSREVAWYDGCNSQFEKTIEVGTKVPNELGLYDMSGNVGEWCQDWYGNYSSNAQKNPTGPSSGVVRVCRGGDWYIDWVVCLVYDRWVRLSPTSANSRVGLRLAL